MKNVKAMNGIGPGAGKGARERATERELARARAERREFFHAHGNPALQSLRHHVSGAIERGALPVVEVC